MLTNLDHDRQWFKTLIAPSHESPVVFVCRSFSELRRRRLTFCKCKAARGSTLLVADRMWLLSVVKLRVLVLILDIYYRIYLMMDVLL